MFRQFTQCLFVCLILNSLGWSVGRADILIDNFSNDTNDRFTNSSSFVGSTYNFSGVGRNNRWATLISSNVALTANHFAVGGTVDFFPGNNPNDAPVQLTVASTQQVGSTDLRAVVFEEHAPDSIQFYNFATEALSNTPASESNIPIGNAGSFQNLNAFMFGISPTSRTDSSIDQAIGRNRITGYAENVIFGSNTDNDSIILEYDSPGDSAYTTHEAQVRGGDSGAPLFVDSEGELLLLGINSFRLDSDDATFRSSGITYTGNVATELQSIISANAVPEPSSGFGISWIVFGLVFFRRRKPALTTPR